MLLNEMRIKLNESRKARNSVEISILSTIIGNISSNAKMVNGEKIVTDEDVLSYLKSHVKGLKETLNLREDVSIRNELNFIEEKFLPKQLSEDELKEIWNQFSNLGEYMKHLKTNFFGQYDGKLASKIAKGE